MLIYIFTPTYIDAAMKVDPTRYKELTAVYPLSPEEYRQLGLMHIYDGDSGYFIRIDYPDTTKRGEMVAMTYPPHIGLDVLGDHGGNFYQYDSGTSSWLPTPVKFEQ